MPGNYLTSHPVFQMLNKEKDFVSIEYGLNEEDSREEFYKKIETRLNKLEFINQTKKKVKLKIITLMKELELGNIKFSKRVLLLLRQFRQFYIEITIQEKLYNNEEKSTTINKPGR